jgi:hypothetical protein
LLSLYRHLHVIGLATRSLARFWPLAHDRAQRLVLWFCSGDSAWSRRTHSKGKAPPERRGFSFWGRATIGVGESDSDECHLQSKWTGHLGPATTHRDRLNSPNYFALNMRASARQGNSEHVEDDTLEQQA